jgi:carbonic anhydrase/acetyltransferase-like protein (isoleucine patch superfamily)
VVLDPSVVVPVLPFGWVVDGDVVAGEAVSVTAGAVVYGVEVSLAGAVVAGVAVVADGVLVGASVEVVSAGATVPTVSSWLQLELPPVGAVVGVELAWLEVSCVELLSPELGADVVEGWVVVELSPILGIPPSLTK